MITDEMMRERLAGTRSDSLVILPSAKRPPEEAPGLQVWCRHGEEWPSPSMSTT